MEHTILFVDDEENILKALRRLMRKTGYNTFFAQSGREALELIREQKFSVIVTDMRMPEMNGVELVREANLIDPVSIKVVLSGYSDIDDIMSAVNGGHIHSYITKPWQEADLTISLMNACELYERRIREKEMLSELKQKNDELKELNENLEKIVQSRTWEIKASNMLLNSILKGAGEEEILGQGARVVSQLSGNLPVAIHSLVSGSSFSSASSHKTLSLPDKVLHQLKANRKPIVLSSLFYYPLLRGEKLLGILIIDSLRGDARQFTGRITTFLSGIRLYLSQQEAIGASSDIISSIDMLLEETDVGE
jgi:CheY-like chemotaxis protein